MIELLGVFLISAIISCVLGPLVIKFSRKMRAEQPILHYVDNHTQKSGTPTMGGIAFILPSAIATLIFQPAQSGAVICAATMLAFGVVGFLDDFIKVRFRRNMGLAAYQKIIAQGAICAVVSAYCAFVLNLDKATLPFLGVEISLGGFAFPFYMLVLLACTNAVNLTDGLDGLAGLTSMVAFVAFGVLIVLDQNVGLATYPTAVGGALAVFLVANCFPAKIFMGDTGSLALGGGLGAVAILSGNTLYLPLIGLPFVVSALSVIIQVVYFKLSGGKRVFKMAPFHHHLERLGIHENKITFAYGMVALFVSVLCLIGA